MKDRDTFMNIITRKYVFSTIHKLFMKENV